MTDAPDVLVVGAGPAGLGAAAALARAGLRVTALDREPVPGGVPVHTHHPGFGLGDLHRPMRGPAYARALVDRAVRAGADVRAASTVTGWGDGGATSRAVTITAPDGVRTCAARAVLLATGCRERPRAARLVPGTRPLGVLTTGTLQHLAARGAPVGRRAVVVGAEHVSFSAVLTLRHAGCSTAAVVTTEARHQSVGALVLATTRLARAPLLTGTRVARILGRRRVEAVELADLSTGATRVVECDTVVFTGDWVPDQELARRGGLVMDPASRGPRVDTGLRTSAPGVFAAGNLLHAAERAEVCAASGARAAAAVLQWLRDEGAPWPAADAVPLECDPPLRWVSPGAVTPGRADEGARARFVLRSASFARDAVLTVGQGDRALWSERVRAVVPNRPLHLSAGWVGAVEPGTSIRVALEPRR